MTAFRCLLCLADCLLVISGIDSPGLSDCFNSSMIDDLFDYGVEDKFNLLTFGLFSVELIGDFTGFWFASVFLALGSVDSVVIN